MRSPVGRTLLFQITTVRLAPRGRRASRAIADHLGRQRIKPALVLCSSSARTRETLEQVGPVFDDEIEVCIDEGLYAASATDLLERLQEVDPHVDSVMLIGHQPAIRELALMLACWRSGPRAAAGEVPDCGARHPRISGQLGRAHAWSRRSSSASSSRGSLSAHEEADSERLADLYGRQLLHNTLSPSLGEGSPALGTILP